MRIGVLLIVVLISGCATTPLSEVTENTAGLSALNWLTGSWLNDHGQTVSEEHWTAPNAGSMLGMNRTIAGNRTVFYEYLRIERTTDGIIYFASPKGRFPPTEFRLVEQSRHRAVFENQLHEFPQRIVYERKGDNLYGRIEGSENGEPRSEHWVWKRVSPSQ